jgi:DNA-binding NtrC family response regulator
MSKIRVLLVDDEVDYVQTLAERLDIRDVGSRVALSGEEALEMLEEGEEEPDVMVLDLRMPGIDGMQVLERVKRDHPQIQVIILTGHGSEMEEKEARRLGAFEYLSKPADTARLIETVRGAWRKRLEAAVEFLRDSKEGFDKSMAAAALAEAGEADMARGMLNGEAAEEDDEADEVESAGTEEGIGALKVLLVDDEEDYVRTMAERMEMREFGSEVALDGSEALRILEEDEVPDVMVLDLRMPGMGGLEVLERVKRDFPGLEVIILTGHGSEEEKREAQRLGAFAYLQKPVDFNALMGVVAQAGRSRGGG